MTDLELLQSKVIEHRRIAQAHQDEAKTAFRAEFRDQLLKRARGHIAMAESYEKMVKAETRNAALRRGIG